MTVPCVELSLLRMVWHVVPLTDSVPRLIPRMPALSGPSAVSVAVTVPLADVVKVCVAAPF